MSFPVPSMVPTRLGRLAVRSIGSGPTALLWHSMFADSRSFDLVAPRLGAVRRLLLVDGPGWGRSERLTRRTSLAECALAAGDLLDELGEGPVDWVGNAWGGHVGYQLAGSAAAHRMRTLVAASSPTTPFPPSERRQIDLLTHVVRLVGVVGPLRRAVEDGMLTPESRTADARALRLLREMLLTPDRRSLALTVRSFLVDRGELGDALARAGMPVLLLVGDDRGDFPPEAARSAAARCASATVVVLPGARTLLPVEQPDAFSDAVLAFWARHEPER